MKNGTLDRWLAMYLMMGAASCFAELDPVVWADTNFHPMWNRKDLTEFATHSANWSVAYSGTDTATITTDNASHAGSQTFLIWNTATSHSIEIRYTFRMSSATNNSGFQFRSRCQTGTLATVCGGSPWVMSGPQNDLGATYTGDIANGGGTVYVNNATTSNAPRITNNLATCKTGLDITNWNDFRIRVYNDTAWTFRKVNGADVLCAKYFFTSANDVKATTQGLIGLQYETVSKNEFRNLLLKNLDGKPTAVNLNSQSQTSHRVAGDQGSIEFSVPGAENYSLQIADLKGVVAETLHGIGPVLHQKVAVRRTGIYFVRLSTASSTFTKQVAVY